MTQDSEPTQKDLGDLDRPILAGLLALLSHDLRNPLSALNSNIGYLDAALDDLSPDEREAIVDAIVSCDSLVNLIGSVDLLAKALRGDPSPPVEPTRVSTVVADVVARTSPLAASHGVALEVVRDAVDSPAQILVNRDMFERSLAYLVRNGVQYSRASGQVMLSIQSVGDRCSVVVADGGNRLSDELCELAFSAAGQIQVKSQANGRYGRGLGLYCAKIAGAFAGAKVGPTEPPPPALNAFVISATRG
jgi:two-component system sensor histidine kinase KdpD